MAVEEVLEDEEVVVEAVEVALEDEEEVVDLEVRNVATVIDQLINLYEITCRSRRWRRFRWPRRCWRWRTRLRWPWRWWWTGTRRILRVLNQIYYNKHKSIYILEATFN